MSKLFRRNLETQTYRGEFEGNMLVEESREGRRIVDHFAPRRAGSCVLVKRRLCASTQILLYHVSVIHYSQLLSSTLVYLSLKLKMLTRHTAKDIFKLQLPKIWNEFDLARNKILRLVAENELEPKYIKTFREKLSESAFSAKLRPYS